MAMDWDARAMHMHLMCIAWQQDPPCTLPDDDAMLRRWLGNPKKWETLKAQIFMAWVMVEGRWLQKGLSAQFDKQSAYSESRKDAAQSRWKKHAHASANSCITDALQSSSSTSSSTSVCKYSRATLEEIYLAYPKRVGKEAAIVAIEKSLRKSKIEPAAMLALVTAYAEHREHAEGHPQYTPNPTTWFNQGRYADETLQPKPKLIWENVN